jgi:hypothetical protein
MRANSGTRDLLRGGGVSATGSTVVVTGLTTGVSPGVTASGRFLPILIAIEASESTLD